jgi:hypothetical protein
MDTKRARTDLAYYCDKILHKPLAPHQVEMVRVLEDARKRGVKLTIYLPRGPRL